MHPGVDDLVRGVITANDRRAVVQFVTHLASLHAKAVVGLNALERDDLEDDILAAGLIDGTEARNLVAASFGPSYNLRKRYIRTIHVRRPNGYEEATYEAAYEATEAVDIAEEAPSRSQSGPATRAARHIGAATA